MSFPSATRLSGRTNRRGPWLCAPALRPVCLFRGVGGHGQGSSNRAAAHAASRVSRVRNSQRDLPRGVDARITASRTKPMSPTTVVKSKITDTRRVSVGCRLAVAKQRHRSSATCGKDNTSTRRGRYIQRDRCGPMPPPRTPRGLAPIYFPRHRGIQTGQLLGRAGFAELNTRHRGIRGPVFGYATVCCIAAVQN